MTDSATTENTELVRPAPVTGGPFARSLSVKLLLLTFAAVMAAEALIFVPLLASVRDNFLRVKLESATVAGLATAATGQPGASGGGAIPEEQQRALLDTLGLQLIAISDDRSNRLIARNRSIAMVDRTIAFSSETQLDRFSETFASLAFGDDEILRVIGRAGDSAVQTEIVLSERILRDALYAYARNFFFLSLIIAFVTGLLLWAAIHFMMVAPIRRMTTAMVTFGDRPSDPSRVIRPADRADEIGVAERELSAMQAKLAETLKEQRRLANLGLAVSKINHDMRNILASSQMISDRLATLPDPKVQRMAPMLIKSLDRALHYTQTVLNYGRAVEREPERRQVDLHATVVDICDLLALGSEETAIEFVNAVPEHFEVLADPEQIHRLLTNLCRNAVQALVSDDKEGVGIVHRLTVGGTQLNDQRTLIFVEDTGPGLAKKAMDNLFQAFRGSARSGGTGLGLAIAMEIADAHGGDLRLAQTGSTGTRFELELPRQAVRGLESEHDAALPGGLVGRDRRALD